MNQKKLFVSNSIKNNKILISEVVKPTMSRVFSSNFLHAKLVWVDAFSLLYSKLLHAKLCLFVFGITFAASHSHFISLCCWFISDYVLLIAKSSWPRGQGGGLQVSGRRFKSDTYLSFSNSSLVSLYDAVFCGVIASVCEASGVFSAIKNSLHLGQKI